MPLEGPLIIGIAGGSGSGKSFVTARVLERLAGHRAAVILHDSYYRGIGGDGEVDGADVNFDHPDALETSLLVRHLTELRAGGAVEIPVYDYATHTRLPETRRIEGADVIIVDGILLLAVATLRDLLDVRIFVDTDADVRLARRIRRDTRERERSVDSVLDQYLRSVRPMHQQFVEPSKQWADIVVPHGGENKVAIDLVVGGIREMLRSGSR